MSFMNPDTKPRPQRSDYESVGRGFESLQARQTSLNPTTAFAVVGFFFSAANLIAPNLAQQ